MQINDAIWGISNQPMLWEPSEMDPRVINTLWIPLVISHSHGIDGPFIDGLPIKNGDFPWPTVSHNQRVYVFDCGKIVNCSCCGHLTSVILSAFVCVCDYISQMCHVSNGINLDMFFPSRDTQVGSITIQSWRVHPLPFY